MNSTWLSWSSGKDSAWALANLLKSDHHQITGLFTTVNAKRDRVTMHGTRRTVLEAQAKAIGLSLHVIEIPEPCSNDIYQQKMRAFTEGAKCLSVTHMAFGDLFLEDIRQYRVDNLANSGIEPIFPLWQQPTKTLAEKMIEGGQKAVITCVDTNQIPADFVGREFDKELLNDLPKTADSCGENGEFHTCVYDGPAFKYPLKLQPGERHQAGQFCWAELKLETP